MCKNVKKLGGFAGDHGVAKGTFWACIHMLMTLWEGALSLEGDDIVGKHYQDMEWEGMPEEMRRLQEIIRGGAYELGRVAIRMGSIEDSPEDSEEDGGCDNEGEAETGAAAEEVLTQREEARLTLGGSGDGQGRESAVQPESLKQY